MRKKLWQSVLGIKKKQVNCGAATVNILIRVCFHCSFTNVTNFPRRAKACQVEQWKITLDYKANQ